MTRTLALLLIVLPALGPQAQVGTAVSAGAAWGARAADRRARQTYRRLMREHAETQRPGDIWEEVRPVVGGWGCLVAALRLVVGLGVVTAIGALVYLLAGG
jgi:hypothetical protein